MINRSQIRLMAYVAFITHLFFFGTGVGSVLVSLANLGFICAADLVRPYPATKVWMWVFSIFGLVYFGVSGMIFSEIYFVGIREGHSMGSQITAGGLWLAGAFVSAVLVYKRATMTTIIAESEMASEESE